MYKIESKSSIDEARGFTDRLESTTIEKEKLANVLASVNTELELLKQSDIDNMALISSLKNDIATGK